ncbi:ABC transporter ATP-binding protein [Flindersiella endophytica]
MSSSAFGSIVWRAHGWLPLIAASSLIRAGVTLALPVVLGKAVDAILAGATTSSASGTDGTTGRWLALAVGLVVLGLVCDLVSAYADTAAVASTSAWLRNRLVRHVLHLGPEGARRFETGDLVSRVSGNAADAANAGPSLVTVGTSVLPPVGALVLLAYIHLLLAGALLAGVLLVAFVLWTFTRATTQVTTGYQEAQGRIAARLSESLGGARTIAAAGTVAGEEKRVLEALPQLRAHGVRTWQLFARSGSQAAIVGPLVLVTVLAAAGLLLAGGSITTGELFAASRYAVLGAGLGGLTGVFSTLARARAGARRAGEVLSVPAAGYGDRPLPDGPGTLEFRGVSGGVLHDIDLTVPGGTAVAVVGPSGAGKSVLAALAARLREPEQGKVLLDGVPLTALSRAGLRDAVGCAFERPVLVGRTVGDAIGLGLEPAAVRQAARATHAHEFVSRLPGAYDTPLADAPMSGGERQRLGIARAWPASRLLVLDDATSSLDMVTEMQISRTLTADHGSRPRTRLIVTHRAATAARADLVVWLDAGRIRAIGTHAELWERHAGYREVFA